jgi:hypothetical protein
MAYREHVVEMTLMVVAERGMKKLGTGLRQLFMFAKTAYFRAAIREVKRLSC